jgi:DNA-binding NarL/FixJ family response regulator
VKPPRVLLADDHTLVVEGFRKLLEPEFEVVGAVEDGRTLLDVAPRLQPDVILLDISMPLLNGIDAARQLKKTVPRAKLIFVTMHADTAYVTEAFRAGGSGYLLKRSAATELLVAVREVLQGRFYVTPLVAKELVQPLTTSRRTKGASAGLTPRQREVLQLLAEGRSNKEMAAILRVSVKAIEFHRSAIARRLGIHTTAELTKYALAHGLVGS